MKQHTSTRLYISKRCEHPTTGSPYSNQDTLDKLNGLSYMPCTAKLDLLDALAEAGANPVKTCLQV